VILSAGGCRFRLPVALLLLAGLLVVIGGGTESDGGGQLAAPTPTYPIRDSDSQPGALSLVTCHERPLAGLR